MKILDKYILKRFLSTFFFVVLILTSIIVVIDITEKIDKYVKHHLSFFQVLGYYGDFVPWVTNLISPITIFIATVYVSARMAAHTEVIAILSSGTSFRRFLLPFFMGAGIVASISFVLNGWIIPNSNKSKLAFEVQYFENKYYFDKRNIHLQIAPNTYFYIQSYNNSSLTGYHFTLEKFQDNHLIEKLSANRIEWDTVHQKWILRDWKIRRIDQLFETYNRPESNPAFQASSKTVNAKTEVSSGDKMDTTLAINPKEFESDYRKYDGMTLGELDDYINTLKVRGATGIEIYEVEKYTRYSSPFTIFVLVFMGVIVSSRKSRGGTGLQIALGFLLSFVFILFFVLFKSFAEAGTMPPQISVWIPNIIFGLIAVFMYRFVPR